MALDRFNKAELRKSRKHGAVAMEMATKCRQSKLLVVFTTWSAKMMDYREHAEVTPPGETQTAESRKFFFNDVKVF